MNIIIRPAIKEDAVFIAEAQKAIVTTPGLLVSHIDEIHTEKIEETITHLSQNQNGIFLVAEVAQSIVAHAFLQPLHSNAIRHVAFLHLAVHPGWQGKGIGRQILKNLIEWAKNSDQIEKIELNVRASNLKAISLYKNLGFKPEGCLKQRIRLDNGEYIDDILMALNVKSHADNTEKVTRIGAYGVACQNDKVLFITQPVGGYKGILDLPGGGLEFGETPEEALRREFIEETNMEFHSMRLLTNITTLERIPASEMRDAYIFYRIGLIYEVFDAKPLLSQHNNTLQYGWYDWGSLNKDNCSDFVRQIVAHLNRGF